MATNEERGVYGGDSNYEYRSGELSRDIDCDINYGRYGVGLTDDKMNEITAEMERMNACTLQSYYSRCNNKRDKCSRMSRTVMQKQTDVRPEIDVRLDPRGRVYDQTYWVGNGVVLDTDRRYSYKMQK